MKNKLSPQEIREICKSNSPKPVIMLIGFGSAAKYFLEYLLQETSYDFDVVVVCRNQSKVKPDVNILKLSAALRTRGRIQKIDIVECDVLREPKLLTNIIKDVNPSIVCNFTRYMTGLKYGSKSWDLFKAYGFWAPMSAVLPVTIANAINASDVKTMFINTSYPDAVNPFIVQNGFENPIFGAGNVNHIIPRFKDALLLCWNTANPDKQLSSDDFNIVMTTSHYHDVLIGKEGATNESEGKNELGFGICYSSEHGMSMQKEIQEFISENFNKIFSYCNVEFPSGQVRNMMVASSVFQIVNAIMHINTNKPYFDIPSVPGFMGELGGYPVVFSNTDGIYAEIDDDMREINKNSIINDGIVGVENGAIIFDINGKKYKQFEHYYCELPEKVSIENLLETAELIKNAVIASFDLTETSSKI